MAARGARSKIEVDFDKSTKDTEYYSINKALKFQLGMASKSKLVLNEGYYLNPEKLFLMQD
jgi:hypothetical protein